METSAFCLVVCLFFSPVLFSYLKNNSNKSFYASPIIIILESSLLHQAFPDQPSVTQGNVKECRLH